MKAYNLDKIAMVEGKMVLDIQFEYRPENCLKEDIEVCNIRCLCGHSYLLTDHCTIVRCGGSYRLLVLSEGESL